jgi:hypothetical protein
MTIDDFKASLSAPEPPSTSLALQAMWWEGKGDWTKAHDLLQHDSTAAGSWVHAYLHRKEPDPPNAAYWYRRAGQPVATGSFGDEWDDIVTSLLNDLV